MEKDKKNKLIVLISGIVVILLMVFGISFAIFRFGSESTNQELVLGDIWMKYTESNGISLENSLPGDEYTNYFEFTITGTNTYTKKDIYYDISLTHGDIPAGKVESDRIGDKYLKFRLIEIIDGVETEIFTDKTYDDLTSKRVHVDTISKSTSTYSKTYRLYMVISEELTYGNSSDAILTTEEFGKIFGSVKVNVTGDFKEKEVPRYLLDEFKGELLTRTNSYIEENGILYVSGRPDDDNPNTTNDIDFNYVWYSGKLWRITAINNDGTMKMMTEKSMITLNPGETFEYSTSFIRQWLEQEFLPTLYNRENVIVEDFLWYSYSGETLSGPIGMLNYNEYYNSFKSIGDSIKNYHDGYLYYHGTFWLLGVNMNMSGFANLTNVYEYGTVHPAINIKTTTELSGGTGTKEDPYVIKVDEVIANATLLNTRPSGEYVKLENDSVIDRMFRIVGLEKVGGKLTTKVVQDRVIKENGVVLKKMFSNDNIYGYGTDDTYWDYYLNNTYLKTLNINMLEKGTYYLGVHAGIEGKAITNYKVTVCKTISNEVSIKECIENGNVVDSKWTGYVGLLRFGEMFSDSIKDSEVVWLITPSPWKLSGPDGKLYNMLYSTSGSPSGNSIYLNEFGARPTINLTNTVVIKSGSGTETDPFVVGLPS